MQSLTIYCSSVNCGDGSAYPVFFYEQICAQVHQNLLTETENGWLEPCIDSLTFNHDSTSPVTVSFCKTREGYLQELKEHLKWCSAYATQYIEDIKKAIETLENSGR